MGIDISLLTFSPLACLLCVVKSKCYLVNAAKAECEQLNTVYLICNSGNDLLKLPWRNKMLITPRKLLAFYSNNLHVIQLCGF